MSGKEVFGLTTSLLTTASGAKMGKTANGAVWLDDKKTSVFDFWQFWRNTEDADVGKFLRLFTELPMDEIIELESLQGAGINHAKKILATKVTTLVHGATAAKEAETAAIETFELGKFSDNLLKVGVEIIPNEPISVTLLFKIVELTSSISEGRRLIKSSGIKVDDELVVNENAVISFERMKKGVKLSFGKKKHLIAVAK
jgi:tyrosyl-tRNA synthetase